MRLFIAITLSREVADTLDGVIRRLRSCCESGRCTRTANLHLTIVFLGETAPGRVASVKEAMDRAAVSPFSLHIGGFGSFRREGGSLFWAGVERSDALTELHRRLSAELRKRGFPLERRGFRPHLTLVRQAVLKREYDHNAFVVPAMKMPVKKITLMKSERPGGKLVYTPLYESALWREDEA